jgi:hypothetical protein
VEGNAGGAGRILEIQLFSRAYFDLLERIPELRGYAAAFSRLEIQGSDLRIRFDEEGVATLTARQIEEIRGAFIEPGGRR